MVRRVFLASCVAVAVAMACRSGSASAEPLPSPAGKVVLLVAGAVANGNGPDGAAFDMAMLERLGTVQVRTRTPWTEGETLFEGVPLPRLLEAAGARGTTAEAAALNGYRVEIPVADAVAARAIVALRADGKEMRVRDKGPLWIVFPWSQDPGLDRDDVHVRAVWQLKELRIR